MALLAPETKPKPTAGFAKTPAVILIIIGWACLIAAAFLTSLLGSVQAIGMGLGALVTVRIVQQWRQR